MRFPGYSETRLDETLEYAEVPFSSVTFPKEKEFEHPGIPNRLFQCYISSVLLHF